MKRSTKYLHKVWWRNVSKTILAGTVAVTFATGSNNAWSSCNGDLWLDDGYEQKYYASAAECEIDQQYRDSSCLHNYYLCNLGLQECLDIFNNCRNTSNELEKRCAKDT